MNTTWGILFLLILRIAAIPAAAEQLTVEDTFAIAEHTSYYKISLSTGGYGEVAPRITGYIPATITFDTETLQVSNSGIRDGAKIEWSIFGFNIYSDIMYENIGTIRTNVAMQFNDLKLEVSVKDGSVRINPETREMNTDDLQLLTNSGSVWLALEVDGTFESDSVDLQQNPTVLPLTKAPKLKIERIKDDIYGYQYDISFDLTSDETGSEKLEGTNITLNTGENVRLVARLSHEKESPFGQWHRFNQYYYDGDELDSKSPAGIPMYLAFALGHEHYQSSHQRPFYFTTYEDETYFGVVCPFRRADVQIEYSTDLSTGSWKPKPIE
ncbi:hypothetical protein [Pelagicoccus sp. SDUM812002]|uniref:hypothetical protein n=1 Tax=Pelagicoccus sp. SDUM812002 TaxID=3041266 RepID=UPI00280D089B|nr:hypothetical protein [Pelagicoccus sp. SDUM812002]MDQ8184006.1 hypothetical protein [Pelagicoccus sp. SDUM812002]